MEYCSFIDPCARAIGAVNTVVNKNGLLYGYNTDYLGFAHLCEAHGVELAGKTVLILGTGGTHNTTRAVALDKGAAKVLTVSRTSRPGKGRAELRRSRAQRCTGGVQHHPRRDVPQRGRVQSGRCCHARAGSRGGRGL